MRFHLFQTTGIAGSFQRLCESWIGERVRDPGAAADAGRLVGALVAMPPALALALVASGFLHAGLPAMMMTAAVLLAIPLILCAAVYLSAAPAAVGLAALAVYGTGLGAAGVAGGSAGPAAWLMVAALPVEAWLVRRSERSVLAGACVAAVVMFAIAFAGPAGAAFDPLLNVVVALAYALFLAFRVHRARAPAVQEALDGGVAAFENAVDGVVVRLSPEGVVRTVSSKSPVHLGLPQGMLVGTPLLDRVHVADRVQYLSMLADLRAGAEAAIADIRLRRAADGLERTGAEFRTFRLEVGACRNSTGELEGFAVVARDICADIAAREALEHALEEAESVQISKNRFLASVSHELRTPLNSIIGFSDILLQEMFGKFTDERQREYVELIQRSGNHLLAVVNAILDVSKLEAGNYTIVAEPFDFIDAVAMAHGMMAHQASQKGVTLIDRVDPVCGEVVADRRAVQQILINLISNAIKFTDKGGVVTIDAWRDDQRLAFSVGDTGIGMSEDDLKKLGRPFFQIHNDYTRAYEGTGLGVSLVKGLVELHGGTLDIASRPGEGTVVTVTLPQGATAPSTDARGEAVNGAEARGIVELKRKSVQGEAGIAAIRRAG